MYHHHSMVHSHLIDCGLFEDNKDQFVLPWFEMDNDFFELIQGLFNNEELYHTPKNDSNAMNWLLQIKSVFLYVHSIGIDLPWVTPSVTVVLRQFYYEFLEAKDCTMDDDSFNDLAQKMLITLSLVFEKETLSHSSVKTVIEIFEKIIHTNSTKYSQETINVLFKIILGLCDFMIIKPDVFNQQPNTSKALFNDLFLILILHTDDINWCLFNQFIANWPYNNDFSEVWVDDFRQCFQILSFDQEQLQQNDQIRGDMSITLNINQEKASEVIIHMMESAQTIENTQNSSILHTSFAILADLVPKRKPMIQTENPLFHRKWYVDDIFELFGGWPLAGDTGKETSMGSFVSLLEQGLIRSNSSWVQTTLNKLIVELSKPDSSSAIEIMKNMYKLLAAHPVETRCLIEPVSGWLKGALKPGKRIDDPLKMTLVLCLAEICTHTGKKVEGLWPLAMKPFKEEELKNMNIPGTQTWQLQICLQMAIENADMFLQEVINLIKINAPLELYSYLMFGPLFFPGMFEANNLDLIVDIIGAFEKSDGFSDELKSTLFFYAIVEFIASSSLFDPMSSKKKILFKSISHLHNQDLQEFVLMSSFAEPSDYAPDLNYTAFYKVDKSVASFAEVDGKLIIAVRTANGVFVFETNLPQQLPVNPPPITASSLHYHTFETEEDFGDFAELMNETKEVEFGRIAPPFDVEPSLKFFTRSGIPSETIHKISEETAQKFFQEYDAIPPRDVIEIGILHFDATNPEMPGRISTTPRFRRFLSLLGSPSRYRGDSVCYRLRLAAVEYVFVYLQDGVSVEEITSKTLLIIFNDTDCDIIEAPFRSLPATVIMSVKMTDAPRDPEDGIIRADVLKWSNKVAGPILHKVPRLIASEHFAPTVALFATATTAKEAPSKIGDSRLRRRQALDKVTYSPDDLLVIEGFK